MCTEKNPLYFISAQHGHTVVAYWYLPTPNILHSPAKESKTATFTPKWQLGWAGGPAPVPWGGGHSHPLPGAAGIGTPGTWFNEALPPLGGPGPAGFPGQGQRRLWGGLAQPPLVSTGDLSPSTAFLQLIYKQPPTDFHSKLREKKIYQL